MNCRLSTQLLSEARDRALTSVEHAELANHLKICPACRNCERQFDLLGVALRRLLES